jgi:signal transduction histidine kinase
MKINVLLIEDNPDHLEITKRILSEASKDYQVDSAADSLAGLKKILEGSYDVILCDYRLPDSTALGILKEMNKDNNFTPFIVMTSFGNEKVAVDVMKEGAYDYIVKDIMYQNTLDIVIKKAIDRFRIKNEKDKLEKEVREAYERLKETQGQLIQAEKMNAIGQLASGVAHEVRNPLGIIMQGINYLEHKLAGEGRGVHETLFMLKESIKRADKIIDSLFDFSRATVLELEPRDINSILDVSLSLLRSEFKFDEIKIVMETKKDLPMVMADRNKLEQVFINLLLNAIQSMPKGGKIFIRTYDKKLVETKNGIGNREEDYFRVGENAVIVEIEDTGIGISEENMKRVFDPFFTTKGPREGAGLGLSVTKNIITMHKGLIELKSKEGQGTRVMITLKINGGVKYG